MASCSFLFICSPLAVVTVLGRSPFQNSCLEGCPACLPIRAAHEMEGELCKGEATASFILTLAEEETLVSFPWLQTSSLIKKCFYNIWEHRGEKEYGCAKSCRVRRSRVFERRNCLWGCSEERNHPTIEAKEKHLNQVQFRRDGGGFTWLWDWQRNGWLLVSLVPSLLLLSG